jgi:hypothetical protein
VISSVKRTPAELHRAGVAEGQPFARTKIYESTQTLFFATLVTLERDVKGKTNGNGTKLHSLACFRGIFARPRKDGVFKHRRGRLVHMLQMRSNSG